MTTFIEGNDDFPEELPEVDDSDTPQASDWNPQFEVLADRTQWLRIRLQRLIVTNWPNFASTDLETGDLVFNEKSQAWHACASIGAAVNSWVSSYDNGAGVDDWEQFVTPATDDIFALAAAPDGTMVTIGITRDVYTTTYAYGAVNWLAGSNNLSVAPSGGDVAYGGTLSSGKWIAVYRNGVLGHIAENDVNGTGAWTVRTLPSAWTTYTGTNNPRVAAIPDHAIAAFIDEGAVKVNVIRSTDNGDTWSTNVQITPTGFTPTHISKPVYSPFWDEWYMLLSATGHTEIVKSTNHGLTWASVIKTTLFFAHDLACSDRILCMVTSDGRFAYSYDRGVTVKFVGRFRHATPATRWIIRAGGGGFMALNDEDGSSRSTLRFEEGASF